MSIALVLLAAAAPLAVSLIQDPSEIAVAIWVVGIAFPWMLARPLVRRCGDRLPAATVGAMPNRHERRAER
jgi:hypothetical protein